MIEIRHKENRDFANIAALFYCFRKMLFAKKVEVSVYIGVRMWEFEEHITWIPIVGWQNNRFRKYEKHQSLNMRRNWDSLGIEFSQTFLDQGEPNEWAIQDTREASDEFPIFQKFILNRRRGEWWPLLPRHYRSSSESYSYHINIKRLS